jgi:hypothetical protein
LALTRQPGRYSGLGECDESGASEGQQVSIFNTEKRSRTTEHTEEKDKPGGIRISPALVILRRAIAATAVHGQSRRWKNVLPYVSMLLCGDRRPGRDCVAGSTQCPGCGRWDRATGLAVLRRIAGFCVQKPWTPPRACGGLEPGTGVMGPATMSRDPGPVVSAVHQHILRPRGDFAAFDA